MVMVKVRIEARIMVMVRIEARIMAANPGGIHPPIIEF